MCCEKVFRSKQHVKLSRQMDDKILPRGERLLWFGSALRARSASTSGTLPNEAAAIRMVFFFTLF